jgi:hypothetical protein
MLTACQINPNSSVPMRRLIVDESERLSAQTFVR